MRAFQPEEWLHDVSTVAREAGAILLDGFGGAHQIHKKGAVDLVTEKDAESEAHITARLRALFPGTGILAEEGGASGTTEGGLWIVDPLDGTTNYAHGFPVFCVSIALERDGVLELGVIHDPTRGELFAARRGGGALLNGRPLRVTERDQLGDSLLATGFPYDIRTSEENNLAEFTRLSRVARAIRRAGAAALDLAYVAAGRFDGFWEEKISPWDIAAGVLLVAEAGGRVTGYRGEALDIRGRRVVATNGRIHDPLLQVLRDVGGSASNRG